MLKCSFWRLWPIELGWVKPRVISFVETLMVLGGWVLMKFKGQYASMKLTLQLDIFTVIKTHTWVWAPCWQKSQPGISPCCTVKMSQHHNHYPITAILYSNIHNMVHFESASIINMHVTPCNLSLHTKAPSTRLGPVYTEHQGANTCPHIPWERGSCCCRWLSHQQVTRRHLSQSADLTHQRTIHLQPPLVASLRRLLRDVGSRIKAMKSD